MTLTGLLYRFWAGSHYRRVARAGWPAAESLDDLGQLMAAWLEGSIDRWPGYYGPPDEETRPFLAELAAACRAGYVTVQSQAGTAFHYESGLPVRDHAVVQGFATPTLAATIGRRCEQAGLTVHVNGLATSRRWARRHAAPWELHLTPAEIDLMFTGCSWAALAALTAATQVTVLDPIRGRDVLWPILADAVRPAQQ